MPLSYEALLRAALTDPDAERELSQTYLRSAAILVIGYTGSRQRIQRPDRPRDAERRPA